METKTDWLGWIRELQSVAQIGLTFCKNPYDIERYQQTLNLSAKMAAGLSDDDPEKILGLFTAETGYATPKVDVRGAIFRGNTVLLTQELIDGGRWTLPGGWADVNSSPAENAVREVREEAGLIVEATKLALVLDRDKAGHTHPHPFHIYKLFFLCDVVGECPKKEGETGEARFFPVDGLPELSTSRTLDWQLKRLYEHSVNLSLPTEFN
jgi:ADP-ribose pyrophosphatase YjhB (NUDIX family)